jgi:hypothetical protein
VEQLNSDDMYKFCINAIEDLAAQYEHLEPYKAAAIATVAEAWGPGAYTRPPQTFAQPHTFELIGAHASHTYRRE